MEYVKNPRFKLAIEQHGDLESLEFWVGLPEKVKNLAVGLHRTECRELMKLLLFAIVSQVLGTHHCFTLSLVHQLVTGISFR